MEDLMFTCFFYSVERYMDEKLDWRFAHRRLDLADAENSRYYWTGTDIMITMELDEEHSSIKLTYEVEGSLQEINEFNFEFLEEWLN